MSTEGPKLFTEGNSALEGSLAVLRKVPADTLEAVVNEVCKRLVAARTGQQKRPEEVSGEDGTGYDLFNAAELVKLRTTLGLDGEREDDLSRALTGVLFVVEQTAYFDLGSSQLVAQLTGAGLELANAKSFAAAWSEHRTAVIGALRAQTIVPQTLDSVGWRLHLQVAQSAMSRLKEPTAVIELGLSEDPSGPNAGTNKPDKFLLEFNHSELASMFQQLEVVQEQLDRIG